MGRKQQYNNLSQLAEQYKKSGHFEDGKAIIYSESGFQYTEMQFPPHFKIPFGVWGKTVKTIGYKLKYCNPEITYQELVDYLHHLFNQFVEVPYALIYRMGGDDRDYGRLKVMREVDRIIDEIALVIYETPLQEINVVPNATCHFLFNPDYDLTKEEQYQLRAEALAKIRTVSKMKELFKAALEMVFKGMILTKKGLARYAKVSKTTTKKYYSAILKQMSIHFSNLKDSLKLSCIDKFVNYNVKIKYLNHKPQLSVDTKAYTPKWKFSNTRTPYSLKSKFKTAA